MQSCSKVLNYERKKFVMSIKTTKLQQGGWKNYLKNLETSNIEHTNKVVSWQIGVQGDVQSNDNPVEQVLVGGLGQSSGGVITLIHVLTFVDELISDLYTGTGDGLAEFR